MTLFVIYSLAEKYNLLENNCNRIDILLQISIHEEISMFSEEFGHLLET